MDLSSVGSILYVTSVDLSLPNGPGVNEREFVAALREEYGDRLLIVLPRPLHRVPELEGEGVTFCAPNGGYRPLRFFFHQLSLARVLRRILATRPVAFVVFRAAPLSFAFTRVMRDAGVPYFVKTLSGNPFRSGQGRGGTRRLLARPLEQLEDYLLRRLLRGATAVDACTPVLVARARTLGATPNAVFLVENATNTSRFSPVDRHEARRRTGLERYDPILGYVGGRPWERGAREMVELAPGLLQRFPRLGVVVVGGGSGLDGLKARARELGIEAHCVFTGEIPYDRVPDYVNGFDVGVAVDRAGRNAEVGNSYQKVRQYLACGKPVVTAGGGELDIGELGFGSVVASADVAVLKSSFERWLSLDEQERQSFARRASQYAREHLSTRAAVRVRMTRWAEVLQPGAAMAVPGGERDDSATENLY